MRKLYTTYQDNNLTKLATACPSAGINLILCFSILLKGVKQLISVLFLLKDSHSWAYNRRNKSKAALILLCGIFSNGLIGQTTINLNPIKDNTIQAEGGRVDKNYGAGSVLLIDRETTKPQRALLQFNLSSIPNNATITSATLTLKKVGGATGAQNISVYQITSLGNWDEGTGPDAGSMSASNWNERQAGVNWVTAGGDYNSAAESTISVSADGTYNWGVTNLVQNWVNGTYPNYGLLMWSTDGGGDRSQDFGTRENVGNEPVLTVTFITSTPGGVSGASIWLKANQGVTTGATLTWADQSGNNRNGVQSTATNQPTVSPSAFNFNPALTFDGTNDYLSVQNLPGLPTGATQVQQFAVANNLNTPGSFQHIFTYGTGTLGKSFGLAKQNGTGNAATVP